ncbi:hypothetical protein CLAIMM_01885 [Cladophialophora immunda]|nr:hypothetical protein CLAIMM_01885 [Cladophialophora immunda]
MYVSRKGYYDTVSVDAKNHRTVQTLCTTSAGTQTRCNTLAGARSNANLVYHSTRFFTALARKETDDIIPDPSLPVLPAAISVICQIRQTGDSKEQLRGQTIHKRTVWCAN